MKRIVATLCALLMLFSAAGALAEAATYTAEADGRNGPIKVEVDLDGGKITDVRVVSHTESPGISDPAIEMFPARIVEAQSITPDTVTGATLTCTGIQNAVADCLAQAGLNPDDFRRTASHEKTYEELETGVVVIGGGGSGLSAAIEAFNSGADVLLLERLSTLGGNTRLSQGMVLRGRTEEEDASAMTAAELYDYFFKYGSAYEGFNPDMMQDFIDHMAENMEWLMNMDYDAAPVVYPGNKPLDPDGDPNVKPNGIVVVHGVPEKGVNNGSFIIDALGGEAKKLGIPMMMDTAAFEILTDEAGEVCGVKAICLTTNTEYTIRARAVIIATGNKDGNDGIPGGSGYEDNGTAMAKALGAKIGTYGRNDTESIYVDDTTHVLTEAGEQIAHLYAVGEVNEIVSTGNCYVMCGARNAWSLYSGRIAGRNAAEESR